MDTEWMNGIKIVIGSQTNKVYYNREFNKSGTDRTLKNGNWSI